MRTSPYSDATLRAGEYSKRAKLSIEKQIGGGIQGVVFSTAAGTAIKALIRSEHYTIERDIYLRLKERGVDRVCGFWIPALVDFDDDLLVIEMQLVSPPFVLDFAGAYMDQRPPYFDDEEVMAEWEAQKREQFTEEQFDKVLQIMAAFRGHRIYLSDVKPGNIEFGNWTPGSEE